MANPPRIDRLARKLFGTTIAERRLKRFFTPSAHAEMTKGKVLQYVGISSMYLTPLEILIYHLLRKTGFDVDYMIYDEAVPINEVITKEREEVQGKEKFWNKSCRNGRRLLSAAGIKYEVIPIHERATNISASQTSLTEILQFRLDGIDFGDIVKGTLFRYYKSLTFGSDSETIARRMLTTALSNYFCVKQQFERNDYRFVLFSHGIYITWQPIVEYCRRNNITYICYDRAKTKDHGNFNVNQPSPDWRFDAAWERYRDRTLTDQEKGKVVSYLQQRELQKGDVYAYNFSARAEDISSEKRRLQIPSHRKCVTIFTNLIWDAANVSRDIAFSSAFECAVQTIEYFRSRDDIQVVIRSHPAEKVLGTSERYAHLLTDHFGTNLPNNVTIISPDDNVNSFTVIDLSSVGVVNTSTVGLEMAVLGKPVILISETHYRDKGFTIDVASPDEYFSAIDCALIEAQIPRNQQALAEKYFFMMMFLYQHKLPTRYSNESFEGYSCEKFAQLSATDPLVRIVRKLEDQELVDFVEWPDSKIDDLVT